MGQSSRVAFQGMMIHHHPRLETVQVSAERPNVIEKAFDPVWGGKMCKLQKKGAHALRRCPTTPRTPYGLAVATLTKSNGQPSTPQVFADCRNSDGRGLQDLEPKRPGEGVLAPQEADGPHKQPKTLAPSAALLASTSEGRGPEHPTGRLACGRTRHELSRHIHTTTHWTAVPAARREDWI